MKHVVIFILIFLGVNSQLFGRVVLPAVFSDNMVLQQNSKVAIWGWSVPGQIVKIVAGWNVKDTIIAKANNSAKWEAKIQTIGAGGPYQIQIFGSSNIQLNNVMLGEVWICSGQSNMEMTFEWGIKNGEQELKTALNPNIRIFHIEKVAAKYPQLDCKATWTNANPENVRRTSALAYFYGRELQQKLNVPVGIIVSAWGGTPAEVWIEKSKIENNATLDKFKYSEHYDWWPDSPGALYNSMIAPIVPYSVAGVIWYQGEANRNNYSIYSLLMKTLIENWREDFNQKLPFYLVQIAPFKYTDSGNSQFLREQQELITKTVPNTGMVTVSDLVDDINDIHPKDKLSVGKRLANYALAEVYNKSIGEYKSPTFKSMKIIKNKIYAEFNNASGLNCVNKESEEFYISGEDENFVKAKVQIIGSTVILFSKQIKKPIAIRYCFNDSAKADVFNSAKLPMVPFRTDSWEK